MTMSISHISYLFSFIKHSTILEQLFSDLGQHTMPLSFTIYPSPPDMFSLCDQEKFPSRFG